nr:MAG TPA: hypothetical protein [Caudoviricetes sp.]
MSCFNSLISSRINFHHRLSFVFLVFLLKHYYYIFIFFSLKII